MALYLKYILKLTMSKFYFVVLFLFFFGCKSQTYQIYEIPLRKIEFGNMGGFTGSKLTYTLLENGQLFISSDFEKKEEKGVSQMKAKKIFKEAVKLKQTGYSKNELGNMSDYIFFNTGMDSIMWNWPSEFSKRGITTQIKVATPDSLVKLNGMLIKTIQSK
jgi:hypothetical protein